jgi:Ca2+-binding EF-hand superfamily protein
MRLTLAVLGATALFATAAVAQDADFFEMADTNHDGKVTQAEYLAFREMGWGYFFPGQESAKVADASDIAQDALIGTPTDAQGVVTHKAYTDAGAVLFKKADKNGDGALDRQEFEASMPDPN